MASSSKHGAEHDALAAADEAEFVHRAALRLDAWHAPSHAALGASLAAAGKKEAAARAFSLALSLRPSAGEASFDQLARLLDDSDAAARLAAAVSEVEPAAVWPYAARARAASSAGKHADAVDALQNALRLAPEDASLWAALGGAYAALGKAAAARRAYGRSVELRPADDVAGSALCALLDDASADAAAAAAFARDRMAVWAASRVAAAARREGRQEDAIQALRSLLRATPDDAAAWEALGGSYLGAGRPAAAAAACAHAQCLASDAALPMPQFAAAATALLALNNEPPPAAEAAALAAVSAWPSSAFAHATASRAAFAAAQHAARQGARAIADEALLRAHRSAAASVRCVDGGVCSAAWKALGDAALASADDEGDRVSGRYAARAYAHALHARPNDGAAWADFALASAAVAGAAASKVRTAAASSAARAGLRAWSAASGGAPPPAALWCTLASLQHTNVAAHESALCHAALLGAAPGARAATALARLYLWQAASDARTCATPHERMLASAEACLESARATMGADAAAAWLATALLHGARGGDASHEAAIAALRTGVAGGGDAEADARLAAALLAAPQPEKAKHEALAPACRAAAWRPRCVRSAAAAAGAMAARGLHAQAAAAYGHAAQIASPGSDEAAALQDAQRTCAKDAASAAAGARALARASAACAHALLPHAGSPRAADALRRHGASAAALVASVPKEACAAGDCLNASRLLSPRLAHALPTMPVAYARDAREAALSQECGDGGALALWADLHEAAARQCRLISTPLAVQVQS